MKPLVLLILFVIALAGCVHGWVGRPVAQLEREMGRPRNIQRTGEYKVYTYPDPLSPGQQMRFWIDEKGVVRQWSANASVPGVFETTIGDDPLLTPNPTISPAPTP
jgi:hypothetical protein